MEQKVQQLEGDVLHHLESTSDVGVHSQLSGCFTVFSGVEICYEWDGTQVRVCVKITGIEIGCATLDAANPGVTLSGNLGLVKASVTVKFDVSRRCLSYEATACYRPLPWGEWTCQSASGDIVCF